VRDPATVIEESSPAGTPRKLIWVSAEASLVSGPGETVTFPPPSAAETFSFGGTQLVAAALPEAEEPAWAWPSGEPELLEGLAATATAAATAAAAIAAAIARRISERRPLNL
jgi:hypothetical protein